MKNKKLLFNLALSVSMIAFFVSCEDYTGKYKITDGEPTIYYVRIPDASKADSLLVGAYMGETVCLVGDNLTSIKELYFNDQKALLNINFITKNTLIVTVPRNVPEERTDKIYMVLKDGTTKVDYDFLVRYPPAEVHSFLCEHVREGEKVVIYGDFFFNEPDVPVSVTVGDYVVPYSDVFIDELTKTELSFKAPPANVTGHVRVKTAYSVGRLSKVIFRDLRGMICNFDGGFVEGDWGRPNASQIQNDPELSLDGSKYMRWECNIDMGVWNGMYDGGCCFNYWGQNRGIPTGNLFPSDPLTSTLKFEANVLQAWSGAPLSILFYAQGDNENKIWDDGYPRGLWRPFYENGTISPFTTDGWITVSIPLKEFKLRSNGEDAAIDFPTAFGGLTIVGKVAGHPGEACSPVILIDNIRVVPGD